MSSLLCGQCKYCGFDTFENTRLHTCSVILYLIKRNHNRFYVDALVGLDDKCKIYKYLLDYFISVKSI